MSRARTPKTVVTFSSLSDALAVEDAAKKHGFPGRIIPVPSAIDAGCGSAWAAQASERAQIEAALASYNLDYEGIFEVEMY